MHLHLRYITYVFTALLLGLGQAAARDFTVVIDPGHGGKDAGAVGLRTCEKDINLKVALKLREMLENTGGVKVVMTRSADNFLTLQERPEIANRRHADIFVSIHANSVPRTSPTHSTVNGAAVYTLGLDKSQANLNVAMRENEVIKLETDYSETYHGFDPNSTESYIAFEMMQHSNMDQSISLAEAVQNQLVRTAARKNNGVRQAPFWVLVRTGMPAILVELDFICNPTQESFMASEVGSTLLAKAICNGITKWRNPAATPADVPPVVRPTPAVIEQDERDWPDDSVTTSGAKTTEKASDANNANAQSPASKQTAGIVYKIQFLTSDRRLKASDTRLKGIKDIDCYRDGNAWKYTSGQFATPAQASSALREIKKLYPDAFVIKTIDGKRVK